MKIWFTISGTNHQKVVPLFEKTDGSEVTCHVPGIDTILS
jgi:hypothetical protein